MSRSFFFLDFRADALIRAETRVCCDTPCTPSTDPTPRPRGAHAPPREAPAAAPTRAGAQLDRRRARPPQHRLHVSCRARGPDDELGPLGGLRGPRGRLPNGGARRGGTGVNVTRVPRPCLTCQRPTTAGSRCPSCEADHQRARNARRPYYSGTWRATSRAAIVAHVELLGWWCPGYQVPGHPATDLTGDHQHDGSVSVLCRSCNGRRGAVDPVFTSRRQTDSPATADHAGWWGRGAQPRLAGGLPHTAPRLRPGADHTPPPDRGAAA